MGRWREGREGEDHDDDDDDDAVLLSGSRLIVCSLLHRRFPTADEVAAD